MNEIKIAQVKRDFDALKVELGVVSNQFTQLKQELRTQYKVKSLKEVTKLLDKLEVETADLEQKRNEKFEYIEEQLKKYRS